MGGVFRKWKAGQAEVEADAGRNQLDGRPFEHPGNSLFEPDLYTDV